MYCLYLNAKCYYNQIKLDLYRTIFCCLKWTYLWEQILLYRSKFCMQKMDLGPILMRNKFVVTNPPTHLTFAFFVNFLN